MPVARLLMLLAWALMALPVLAASELPFVVAGGRLYLPAAGADGIPLLLRFEPLAPTRLARRSVRLLGEASFTTLTIGDLVLAGPHHSAPLAEPGPPIDGVVGAALSRRRVVWLDFASHRLHLLPPADFRPPSGAETIAFPHRPDWAGGLTGEIILDGQRQKAYRLP